MAVTQGTAIRNDTAKQSAYDFLYLVSCGIHERTPDKEWIANLDWKVVYAISRLQNLEAITCMALEKAVQADHVSLSDQQRKIFHQWQEAKNKAIRKNLLLNSERARLFAFMEQNKIWHVPLKGALLQYFYPKLGMRQMSDNDIWFDEAGQQQVYDWFVRNGYCVQHFREGNHDVYHKAPVYNFEMHLSLFSHKYYAKYYAEWNMYYTQMRDKLILQEGTSYEYRFSYEDFYVYLIVHSYKHFKNNGVGLRFLLDDYVCYHKNPRPLDDCYIKRQLEKLGILEFEQEMRELSEKIFANPERLERSSLSERQKELLEYHLFSSVYGTQTQYYKNKLHQFNQSEKEISGKTKLYYIWTRLFLSRKQMKIWCRINAPVFIKHPWMMPLAPIWRFFWNGKSGFYRWLRELKILWKL